MPTYQVQVNVNVPGVGDKTYIKPGIVAAGPEAAIATAKADVQVTILALQQTAP